jgi:hypothetical protein
LLMEGRHRLLGLERRPWAEDAGAGARIGTDEAGTSPVHGLYPWVHGTEGVVEPNCVSPPPG